MSQAMRKLSGAVSKFMTTAIFINQIREKVGIIFGNPEVTPGGRALKFYASVRIDVRKQEALKQGDEIIGNRTRAKVVKNKVAPPFKQGDFDIVYGKGISREGCILDLALEKEIIKKSGTWYSFGAEKIGQGKENVRDYLRQNPEICQTIEEQIRIQYNLSAINRPKNGISHENGKEQTLNSNDNVSIGQ
jgi:recombination protein RecA